MKSETIKKFLLPLLVLPCLMLGGCGDAHGAHDAPYGGSGTGGNDEGELTGSSNPTGSLLGSGTTETLGSSLICDISGMYLKVDGIEGNSNDAAHNRWIDVIDFSCGLFVDPEDENLIRQEPFIFTHYLDNSSLKLQDACRLRRLISFATFEGTRSLAGKQETVYKIEFTNLRVSSIITKTIHEGSSTRFAEEVTILAKKEVVTYQKVNDDNALGSQVEFTYNFGE